MAQKKNSTREKIIEFYMDEVLTKKETSKSIYAFAKENGFDETDFYEHFNSFEALEKNIFAIFCDQAVNLLSKSEDYETYDSKHKLLSFYYTFFEVLTANRSYVSLKLKENKNKLETLKKLSALKKAFLHFYKSIEIERVDFKNDKMNKFQEKGIDETAWGQLLFTMQFWLDDDSNGFEKTDIFIEKSIHASFDVMNIAPVKSVFDFAKFIWKEKMQA